MIWVWGENSPDAGLESALTHPALIPELGDTEGLRSGKVVPGSASQRDLPYGWDTWAENVMVRSFGCTYPTACRADLWTINCQLLRSRHTF